MKKFIRLAEFNCGDFLGHQLVVCSQEQAEFEIILDDNDNIVERDEGTYLVRHGIWYLQTVRMSGFRGVNFKNEDDFNDNIQCKLVKLGSEA